MDASPELTYFTCTLDQAAKLNKNAPRSWKTINEFLDCQAQKHPNVPAASFAVPDSPPRIFTFSTLRNGALTAADALDLPIVAEGSKPPCVALLCYSSIEFLFTWLGLLRAGCSVLLIQRQCTEDAIAKLCRECEAKILFYDNLHEKVALASINIEGHIHLARKLQWATPETLDAICGNRISSPIREFQYPRHVAGEDAAFIFHTSGTSTGLPKPIVWDHLMAIGVLPCFDGHEKATFTTTPLYHGGIADCFRAWTSNAMIWLFPEADLPITSTNLRKCFHFASQCREARSQLPNIKYFSCVPLVLQMFESEDMILRLQEMDIVGVGGAALPIDLGRRLVQQGVNLISRYGSTECGFLLSSHRNYALNKDWQFLRAPKQSHLLKFEKQDDSDLYELVVGKDWPHMAKRNRKDGSFSTSDLFTAHQSVSNAWFYHSRSDSQITLITGKKFDPAPLEDAFTSSSSFLADVLIFGNGRQFPGMLAFPSEKGFQLGEEGLGLELRHLVAALSKKGQEHTRIPWNMIVIISDIPNPPLEKSAKGTILRGVIEKRFSKNIEDAYDSRYKDGVTKKIISISDIEPLIQDIVNLTLSRDEPIEKDADFYHSGVDSPKATQLRAQLQKDIFPRGPKLPSSVIYDCGNIEGLVSYVERLWKGEMPTVRKEQDDIDEMTSFVREFSDFPDANNIKDDTKDPIAGEVVILTGATGSLGAHILNDLQYGNRDRKELIICLVRAPDESSATSRVQHGLGERDLRGLSESTICCPSIPSQVYESIRSCSVTIIHAAWAVDFSLPLGSFKPQFQMLRELLCLALSFRQTAKFVFCSSTASITAVENTRNIPETISDDPRSASALGYSRSKWVAEAICKNASQLSMLKGKVSIARIGQLTGDTVNGSWNMKEAWPLMLRTVRDLKCLPNIDEPLSWLPMDIAAMAVVDVADFTPNNNECYICHIASNSQETTWKDILTWLGCKVAFSIVPPKVWLDRLARFDKHPAKPLLDLWMKAYGEGREPKQITFSTKKSEAASDTMKYRVPPVDRQLVYKIWNWMEAKQE